MVLCFVHDRRIFPVVCSEAGEISKVDVPGICCFGTDNLHRTICGTLCDTADFWQGGLDQLVLFL